MVRNEASWDRVLRVVLGLALLALLYAAGHPGWALLGLVFVATGLAGFCPLYRAVGFSTAPRASGSA